MQAKAHAKFVRIAPRKVQLVVDLIRGKQVGEAIAILRHTPKSASPVVEKLLNSAIANAEFISSEKNESMDVNSLFISEVYVNQGPTLKRFRPRAMGRASKINKRTSHISLVVTEK
ncbi:50S ribosomal protein L22 [Paenibacillus wenxiniae]|uniref:Large ribosomal subunit protein uL22 n=1 Tax=Paenibacillus wenxiniae TaxID=1636843 RepID=A0ABW4RCT7_9BACL